MNPFEPKYRKHRNKRPGRLLGTLLGGGGGWAFIKAQYSKLIRIILIKLHASSVKYGINLETSLQSIYK